MNDINEIKKVLLKLKNKLGTGSGDPNALSNAIINFYRNNKDGSISEFKSFLQVDEKLKNLEVEIIYRSAGSDFYTKTPYSNPRKYFLFYLNGELLIIPRPMQQHRFDDNQPSHFGNDVEKSPGKTTYVIPAKVWVSADGRYEIASPGVIK